MLQIAEVETEEVLKNSSNEVIKPLGDNTYVALYDDEEITKKEVDDFILKSAEAIVEGHPSATHDSIVFMTKDDHAKLHEGYKKTFNKVFRGK